MGIYGRYYDNRAWLKFDKSVVPYFDKAYLCLYKYDSGGLGVSGKNFQLYYSHNQTWHEKDLTWDDLPDWVDVVVSEANITSTNEWICFEVTEAFGGLDDNVTYMIRKEITEFDVSSNFTNYTVGETGVPSWDLYVDEENPDVSYNSTSKSYIFNITGKHKYSYIRVSPNNVFFPGSRVDNATLYLYIPTGCNQSVTIGVYYCHEENASESMTYFSQPYCELLEDTAEFNETGWVTFDVKEAAQKAALKGGYLTSNITLKLKCEENNPEIHLNTLDGGETEKNFSYFDGGNQTDYLKLPKLANVTSAHLNVSGFSNFTISFISSFNTESQDDNPGDVCYHDGKFYVVGEEFDRVYRYSESGSYDSWYFDVSSQETEPQGVEYNGTYFWVVGKANDRVLRYQSDGTYDNWYFSVSSQTDYPRAVRFNGTHFFVLSSSPSAIFVYDEAGNYQSSITLSGTNETNRRGLALERGNFWVVGTEAKVAFRHDSTGAADGMSFSIGGGEQGIDFNGTHFCTIRGFGYSGCPVNRYKKDGDSPTFPFLDVGGDGDTEWSYSSYSGEFLTEEQTNDFAAEINDYLATCSPDADGYCSVPLVLHSDTAGILEISDININYTTPVCFYTEEHAGTNYDPRIEIGYSYSTKNQWAFFRSSNYSDSTYHPYVVANISWAINATNATGTFEPFGQTDTQWIWKICSNPETGGPIDIYLNLTDIVNSTGHSLTELPSCVTSFWHWSNETNVEARSEANITGNTAKRVLYNLQNGTCAYIWENITFNDCTPGDYFDFNFSFHSCTDSGGC